MCNPKICDFGMSKIMGSTIKTSTINKVGSVRWAAPEYLDFKRVKERNEKGDTFSFGVILWELVTRELPWDIPNITDIDITLNVIGGSRLDIPQHCVLRDIIQDCWKDGLNLNINALN